MSYWIAVVDDESICLTNAKNLLQENNMRVSCLRSGSDLLEFVEKHTPDLILLDILMPDMDGFDTYRALRQFEDSKGRPRIPVIFLTGEDSSEAERRGLKAGASDFIHKPFDKDILIKRINNTIINNKTIESLTEEARLDKLTGFLNKSSGTEKVSGLCRNGNGVLIIIDLDNFKLVNDLYGHDMGDRILIAFAEVIRLNTRSSDVICRIGGDEFMAFISEMDDRTEVASFTHRLNDQFQKEAEKLMGKEHGIPLGISIGAAFTSKGTSDYQILFQYADSALYEVKRNGKHDFRIYDPDKEENNKEEELVSELERAIHIMSERGEGKGAMILGQEAFAWNYRFIERFLTRYGGSAIRIMFMLTSDEKGIIFSEMVSAFGNVMKNTLRKSDIIIQWLQNRYFVVLPLLEENDYLKVVERIKQEWEKTGYTDRVRIEYAISTLRKNLYSRLDENR